MGDPLIAGPHKKERVRADLALGNGDTNIDYRGVAFSVEDDDRGWTYHIGSHEFSSLEEVFDTIDADLGKKKKKAKR